MNKRNFIKGLLGLSLVPVVGNALPNSKTKIGSTLIIHGKSTSYMYRHGGPNNGNCYKCSDYGSDTMQWNVISEHMCILADNKLYYWYNFIERQLYESYDGYTWTKWVG